ncbi:MAG: exodeoxyribonuclease V subunit beta [Chitinivibrionales bacterium]|nr:exodeoxyribonuclease V subunit beta [Chitinivibrionales bacterium]
MHEFEIKNCPLTGTHAITANAGTGKTFTIEHLVLRLLLEKAGTIRSILIVTFTDAATQELKQRIRIALDTCRKVLAGLASNPLIEALIETCMPLHPRLLMKEIVEAAIRSYDHAAIYTIHGFCHRVLTDYALETGMLFDAVLLDQTDQLISLAVAQFWRKRIASSSAFFARFMLAEKITPLHLEHLLHRYTSQTELQLTAVANAPDTAPVEQCLYEKLESLKQIWSQRRNELTILLLTSPSLKRTTYKQTSLERLFTFLDTVCRQNVMINTLVNQLEKVTSRCIQSATKKGFTPLSDPFFLAADSLVATADDLQQCYRARLIESKIALLRYYHDFAAAYKLKNNLFTFDDLLHRVNDALHGPNKAVILEQLRKSFTCGLIDEFQDTDPLQYRIFSTIFNTPAAGLFFIGDAKQAIYSFRGADIFTFISAVQKLPYDSIHTLLVNRRCCSQLITAINTLFCRPQTPFLVPEIPYYPSKHPQESESERQKKLFLRRVEHQMLQIWFFPSPVQNKRCDTDGIQPQRFAFAKTHATDMLCRTVTRTIRDLLHDGTIGRHADSAAAVQPHDIAILVRSKHEARQVKEMLDEAEIPSLLHHGGNIFDSVEAIELFLILNAVAAPQNHGRIRAAMSTTIFGATAKDIYASRTDERYFEKICSEFTFFNSQWTQNSLAGLFSLIMNRMDVRKRLLSLKNGHRRLTNVLHLFDILIKQNSADPKTPTEMVTWLSTQMHNESQRVDEHELRMEHDENAVIILTMHKAKGLEFPIVFCPFLWHGSTIEKEEFMYHTDRYERFFDCGSSQRIANKQRAEIEALAENIRLAYVALTRSKYLCYVGWGRFHAAETSALAYLLHAPREWQGLPDLEQLTTRMQHHTDQTLWQELIALSQASHNTLAVSLISEPDPITPLTNRKEMLTLSYRQTPITLAPPRRITSFSALAAHCHAQEKIVLQDEEAENGKSDGNNHSSASLDASPNQKTIFTLAASAQTGNLVHEILEALDFATYTPSILADLISQKLPLFGLDQTWLGVIQTMVEQLMHCTIFNDCNNKPLKLRSIGLKKTCREMEFYFPITTRQPARLSNIFARHLCPQLQMYLAQQPPLSMAAINGFMHGYIDLLFEHNGVFYLVDWKTNHLGHSCCDYSQQRLCSTIVDNLYYLQYHIYVLALNRYLSTRIKDYSYESHFGGIFYLFCRGIEADTESKNGIFHDKPSTTLLTMLHSFFNE